MAKKQTSSLRDKSIEELHLFYKDTQKSLYELINQWKLSKKLDTPHLIRRHKRDIARVLTVLQEKQGVKR